MKSLKWVAVGIAFFIYGNVTAQLFEFHHYTTQSGLPQSVVNSAAEDQFHQVWFSTYDGLSVFDGMNFQNISIKHGLPVSVVINTVFYNNKIYSGLRGSLVEIDPETKAIKVLATVKENNDVGECIPANNKLFFASDTSLYQIENGTVSQPDLTSFLKTTQISFLQIIGNRYVLATPEKLVIYTTEKDFPLNPAKIFPLENTKTVFEFNGKLYVYADYVLYEVKGNELRKQENFRRNESIRNIKPFSNSRLIGYGNSGLVILDSSFQKLHEFNRDNGLITNLIIRVFIDSNKNIWLLTEGAGVVLMRSIETLNFNRQSNFPLNFPYVVINRSPDEIFLGTVGDGVGLISYSGEIKKRWFQNRYIMAGAGDKTGRIWFDVQNIGLYYLDRNSEPVRFETPRFIGGTIRSMKLDSKNRLWMVSNYGIYSIENQKLTTHYDGPSQKTIPYFSDFDLLNDSTLVLASEVEGLFLFTDDKLSHMDSLRSDSKMVSIKRVFTDQEKRLIVTSSDGVFLSTDYKNFTKIADSEKHDAGAVWGLMVDRQKRIWASASKGIFVISPDSSVTFLNENFGLSPSEYNRFSLAEDDNGFIWAGSVDNLIKIDPDIAGKIPDVPTLRLKNIVTSSGFAVIEPVINLKRDVQWIQFDLGLSDFVARDKISFRYRILSRDSVWLPATKSSAILIDNLTPGNFEIEISAIDFLGRESNHIRSAFFLPYPYWRSSWFILSVIAAAAAIGYNIYLLRLRVLHEREVKLSALVKERTQALENNKRFVENLIDSATEIIFTTDTDGRIHIWNLEAQNFFGFTKDEIEDQSISIIDASEYHPLNDIFNKVVKGKIILREKIELKSRYAELGLLLVSSYPMLDENGKVVSIVYILTDLKQHHLLESELLEKEKFIAGLDVLKNTLSTITHYINNSITAVLGVAEMAKTKDKYKIKLVEVAINQSLEIRAVIKSLENINSQLDFKTTEYPDLTHHIFDIKNEVEMHLQSYKDLTTKPDETEMS